MNPLPQKGFFRAVALLVGGGLALASGTASAAVVTLVGDNTGGFGGQNWNQANDWSNNAAPSAGNDYHVGDSTGKVLEAPTGGPHTFGGDSLTLHATGTLRLRTSSAVTISSLILNGGTLNNFLTGRVNLGAGLLSVTDHSFITAANPDGRDWTFNQSLSGSGNLTLSASNTGNEFRFNGDGSAYSGVWNVEAGTLLGFASGSLGSGNLVVGTGSGGGARLDARYNINSPGSSLTLNSDASMTLNNNHVFAGLTIGGNILAAGFYSFNDLNTLYDGYFVDGGIGSITVVPEPSSWALLLAGIGLLWFFRRQNRRGTK